MSGFDYTSTELLADIKRKAFVPISQITFDDAAILSMADEEIQTGMVPFLLEVREEYLVDYIDYTVNGDTRAFDIPTRAIGAKLRQVTVLIGSNDPDQPNEKNLPQMNADEAVFNNSFNNFLSLQAFFVRDNQIILSPGATSFAGYILRMYYFKRPNKLVQTSDCAQIVSISGNQVVVSLVPTKFGSGNAVNITSDIVKGSPPFKLLGMDLPLIVDTTTNTVTFPNLVSSYNIQVGDYVCLQGESPIPILPVEMFTFLAQRVAVKLLMSMGDEKNFQIATDRLKEMDHNVRNLLSNRIEGNVRKVVNQYSAFSNPGFRRF